MEDPWQIRPSNARDIPRMSAIEGRSFSDPWRPEDFREVLASPGVLTLVAEWPEGIGGYVVARRIAGMAEILNLAVAPEHQRRGIASALLTRVLDRLRSESVGQVYLEVRRSNRAAQELYRRFGFALVGVRRSYYRKPDEDALILAYQPTAPAREGPIQSLSD